MIRTAFALFIILHGLIHLMGFVRAFRFAGIQQLTLDISRPAGVLWLGAALLFTTAAVLLLLPWEWWWMTAAAAILLSQVLIAMYWSDAKFGTVANAIILIGALLGYGSWSFNAGSRAELAFFSAPPAQQEAVLTKERIAGLPAPVRKWLLRSGAVGREIALGARLKQKGELRTAPDGAWMAVTADQRILTGRPAFIWIAEVRAAPGIYLAARDTYREGKGRMFIRALSLVPVADAAGPEIDQGAMVRYLAEIIWAPSAAVSDYLRWEDAGPHAAKATMTWGGITASGVFTFSPEGDMTRFSARRYYDRKGGATMEEWVIRAEPDSVRVFEGVRIPSRYTVTWRLAEGDFTWYRLEIVGVHYNDHGGTDVAGGIDPLQQL